MSARREKFHRKSGAKEASGLGRAGMTLVETMVSVLLLMILMAMVVGIVSPAFKVFIRMQKLQFAQMILDNVVEDVQGTVREATEYVKIYDTDDIADANGVAQGDVLEYVNTDGFVMLLSTGGCEETSFYRGTTPTNTTYDAVDAGQLLYRYYRKVDTNSSSGSNEYFYYAKVGGSNLPIARAATTAFGSGYYMGNKLQITYDFDGVAEGQVKHLKATASLYDDQDEDGVMDDGELVVSDSFVIDLRYSVVREDGVTATVDEDNTMAFLSGE